MRSDRFRAAVEHRDVDHARELFHEDAVFRSPVLSYEDEGLAEILVTRTLGFSGSV